MLDQQDILALKEIFQPQFEHLSSQVRDLKETLNTENERRRDDVSILYDKDREVRALMATLDSRVATTCNDMDGYVPIATVTALEARIVVLETLQSERVEAEKQATERKRFTLSQILVAGGLLLTALLFAVDKIISIFTSLGGTPQ